jgi:hypoxanthine phosphoribosyltransferase
VAIGTVVTAVYRLTKYATNRVSWRQVEKGVKRLLEDMKNNQFIPGSIMAMGRGGAVMAGLMSNKFYLHKSVPVFMVDRNYKHSEENSQPEINCNMVNLSQLPEPVLLVGGINASGRSIIEYKKWLKEVGVQKVRTAVLVESTMAKPRADYYFRRNPVDPRKLKMPWYKGGIIDWVPPKARNADRE